LELRFIAIFKNSTGCAVITVRFFVIVWLEVAMKTQRWQDWVILVLGIWLFFSPFWMSGYASTNNVAAWDSYVLGIATAVFAIAAISTGRVWEEWVELVLGIWLILSPFFLSFYNTAHGAAINQIVVGLLIAADAVWILSVAQGRQVRS
jgi:hypothetical protein